MNSKFKEYGQYALIIIFVLAIRLFVIDVISVQGCSMYPTLNESHDKVILEKYKQFTDDYNRSDIIVINEEILDKRIIKRVIGLPNETVEIKNGYIYINGELLKEEYLDKDIRTYPDMKVIVPEGHIFVLGDNRGNSKDSRHIGVVKIEDVLGKAIYRFNFNERLFNGI
ncbi:MULTISPECIES: signal peptidase I [unclassified Clostridium]|uniref:signal peptidase I n=1 Tax=unclassified Clostridium TaxID=2614128 RepID=UPI0032170DB2